MSIWCLFEICDSCALMSSMEPGMLLPRKSIYFIFGGIAVSAVLMLQVEMMLLMYALLNEYFRSSIINQALPTFQNASQTKVALKIENSFYVMAICVEEDSPGVFTTRRKAMESQIAHMGQRLEFEPILFPMENIEPVQQHQVIGNHIIDLLKRVVLLRQQRNNTVFLILEDDAELHPEFFFEFESTIAEMPRGWSILHLCPGFLHSRYFLNQEDPAPRYKPEKPILIGNPFNRFFAKWPHAKAWAGGPIAFAINWDFNSESAPEIELAKYLEDKMQENHFVIDVSLTHFAQLHSESTFATRDPPLCRENNRGMGSTWKTS